MQTPWQYHYAARIKGMKSSAIRELLKLLSNPEMISFAGGMPAPELFPAEQVKQACVKVLSEQSDKALQYGESEGYRPLRQWIADQYASQGLTVSIDNVMITSGSQQALDLLGMLFINAGDKVLCETPTYLGALQAFNAYGPEYISLPSDQDGLQTDGLETAMRYGAKFIYILPNFQNPTGTSIPIERRKQIHAITNDYGMPVIEDDPYGQLRFEGDDIPSVFNLSARPREGVSSYNENIIYLSTFSKILSPGMRLAWVLGPAEVISRLVQIKQGVDLHTSSFTQMIAYEIAKDGFIAEHVKNIVAVYRERRNVMLDTLEEHMPDGVSWTHPQGGLFLWVKLPEHLSSAKLFPEAIKQNVAYVSGESFFPNGGGQNTMRLNFSMMPPDRINEGIQRLSRVIKENLK